MVSIHALGQNFTVLFKSDVANRLAKSGFEPITQTSCAIVGTDGRVVASGSAFKSTQDSENDLRGAELALGRALRRLTPDKVVRAKFWAVFNRSVQRAQSANIIDVEPLE